MKILLKDVAEAKGPEYMISEGKKCYVGKLFEKEEEEKVSDIVRQFEGMTISEANDLLERIKAYLTQAVFSPRV